jgi:phage tail protein X
MAYYDRYQKFRKDGEIEIVPGIRIDKDASDIYVRYDKNKMRMDMLSYKYYGDPDYGWLILQANPHVSSMEYFIPDGVSIRIPYPLSRAILRYEQAIDEYNNENN